MFKKHQKNLTKSKKISNNQKIILEFNKKAQEYKNKILQEFNNVKNTNNFIDYEQFWNSFSLKFNYSEEELKNHLFTLLKKFFVSKKNLVLDQFVLTFSRDPRFNLNAFVPKIDFKANSNVADIDLTSNNDAIKANLNTFLNNLLDNNFKIEFLRDCIIFKSQLGYKLFIGEKFIDE